MIESLKNKYKERFEVLVSDRHIHFGLDFHTEENHVKMLVVDGKYFVVGGTGLHPQLCREEYDPAADQENPTYGAKLLDPAVKDSDVVGCSQSIASCMRDQFFNLYRIWEIRTHNKKHVSRFYPIGESNARVEAFHAEEGPFKNARMKVLVGGPEHRGNNPIVKQYEKRIIKAREEVRLASYVFGPSKKIRRALKNAKIVNPNLRRIGHFNGTGEHFSIQKLSAKHCGRGLYYLVDKVYEFADQHAIYHKKIATFDNTHMIIGSFNLGKKSAKHDHEIVLVVKDRLAVEACRNGLKEDKKMSSIVAAETGFFQPFLSKILSFIFAKTMQNIM
jgi:phosphatidylserine/phosphatidylglycerophosphate/cardiolipin synthase-like enzyme